jgi:hypothetical protein
MNIQVFNVANAVVREPDLPDLATPLQLALGAEGKAAFDELDSRFHCRRWTHEQVDMVGHDDEVMQASLGKVMV